MTLIDLEKIESSINILKDLFKSLVYFDKKKFCSNINVTNWIELKNMKKY